MKLTLIAITAVGALSLGNSVLAHEPEAGNEKRGGRGYHHSSLERTMEQLQLTDPQKSQVQPIIDQATPKIESIRREAMEKTKAVVENAMAQIRPLLTPEQQKKLDEAKTERRGGRAKQGGRGGHRGQRGQDDQGGQGDQDNG
ncbi:MAG: hypothetical protein M3Q46_05615 [Verrucomicrobiota bacterium]|nr:hypothetical protein [Verrucomicrobiota bacterium]